MSETIFDISGYTGEVNKIAYVRINAMGSGDGIESACKLVGSLLHLRNKIQSVVAVSGNLRKLRLPSLPRNPKDQACNKLCKK